MQLFKKILEGILVGSLSLLLFLVIFENRLQVPAWLQVAGRMHPMFLHFPIVLLIVSFFSLWLPVHKENEWLNFLWLCAALSAVITAVMGLLLSLQESSSSNILVWHKWGGVAVAIFAFLFYTFHRFLIRKKIIGKSFTIIAATGIVLTSHWGADITHGENFVLAPVIQEKKAVPIDQAIAFDDVIKPILDEKCINCHGTASAKGGLLLENAEGILRGGKTGPLLIAGKPDNSLIIQRIHLPLQEKKHMPPASKEQLTTDEASLIYSWIKSGAAIDKKIITLPVEDSFRVLATHYLVPSDNYVPNQPVYSFKAAGAEKIKTLNNNYRIIEQLGANAPALSVHFYGKNAYSAKSLEELAPLKEQIIELSLAHMPVKNEDLRTVQQMINLQRLNLNYTDITNDGLQQLSALKDLQELSLTGTEVNYDGLKKLLSSLHLYSLVIWNTKTDTLQAAELKKQFSKVNIESGFIDDGKTILPLSAPMIQTQACVFENNLALKIKHPFKGAEIRYTLDGSTPDSVNSPLYKNPVVISSSAILTARAFKSGWLGSDIIQSFYYKKGIAPDSVELLTQPDPKYKAPNGNLLIDGNLADIDYDNSNGQWVGYTKKDAAFLFYYSKPVSVQNIFINALENVNNYVFPPAKMEVWVGTEKNQLKLIGKINPQMPKQYEAAKFLREKISVAPVEIKYLKLVLQPLQKLPSWHGGKGEPGWVFISEVVVN